MSNEMGIETTVEMTVLNTTDSEMTELSQDQLDQIDGGSGLSLGGFDNFFQSSGSGYSEDNFFSNQGTFAGPNGAGTFSTTIKTSKDSWAFQTTDIDG